MIYSFRTFIQLFLLCSSVALPQTLGDTIIFNQASASYSVSGLDSSTLSNTVKSNVTTCCTSLGSAVNPARGVNDLGLSRGLLLLEHRYATTRGVWASIKSSNTKQDVHCWHTHSQPHQVSRQHCTSLIWFRPARLAVAPDNLFFWEKKGKIFSLR